MNFNKEEYSLKPIIICGIAIFAVLYFVYFPVLTAGESIVDDGDMIRGMNSGTTIEQIFFPRSQSGGYYRPLLGLSFLIDKKLWALNSTMMHQENLLIHICNTFILFLIARLIFVGTSEVRRSFFATGAALLFGLHPITVESVAWISGRTDLLATTFVLASALFMLQYRATGGRFHQAASYLMLVPGVLAKEVAFGFLPVLLLFNWRQKSQNLVLHGNDRVTIVITIVSAIISMLIAVLTYNHWLVLVVVVLYVVFIYVRMNSIMRSTSGIYLFVDILKGCSVFGIVAGLFFFVRRIAFTSDIPRVGHTLTLMMQDTNNSIRVFFEAAGFYVKKFIWPIPLNFYIKEIDPLYTLLGIGVLFACIYSYYAKSEISIWLLAGIAMFLPAFACAFGTIAWTSYAERYIYTSCAFWSLCLVLLVKWIFDLSPSVIMRKVSCVAMTLVLVLAGWFTHSRANVWQSNVALMKDTVEKSPTQKILRGIYMSALIGEGSYAEAKKQYMIAKDLYELTYDPRYDLAMADILIKEGNPSGAEPYIAEAIKKSASPDAFKTYADFLQVQLSSELSSEKRVSIINKLLDNLQKVYNQTENPAVRFRMGQMALAKKESQLALRYFSEAARGFPVGSEEQTNASKMVENLSMQSKR